MTDFEKHLEDIQQQFHQRIEELHQDVMGTALALLREDIENDNLNAPGMIPDAFMLRANQIGIALFRQGFFSLAERMYRKMCEETLRFRKTTGKWRHIGAIYTNIAGACAAQGNIDQAVIELLRAAEDDVHTYKILRTESYALTGLLQNYFANPVRSEAIQLVQAINPRLVLSDIERIGRTFAEREYAFLAYLRLGIVHTKSSQTFPNEYSKLQLFSAIRNLSALLEYHLKTLTKGANTTLFPTLETLFRGKFWWNDFDNTRKLVGATKNTVISVDSQLDNAHKIVTGDETSVFWKGLIIAYIARNFTAHDLDPNSALVTTFSEQVIGHILHVIICADSYM